MHIRGSSLIESLVAMSVFSIGSAATGAWFVQISFSDVRASRVLAAHAIAASLEARMRVNPTAVATGGYMASSNAADCAPTCDAAALAADDMRRFRRSIAAALGSGASGVVDCKKAGNCVIRITRQGREVLAWSFEL